jgi:hypothetical protein
VAYNRWFLSFEQKQAVHGSQAFVKNCAALGAAIQNDIKKSNSPFLMNCNIPRKAQNQRGHNDFSM